MEIFEEASVVRLRSHHEKYLLADDDEENVCQERGGNVENARWTVELVEYNTTHIRLKSCYGKYLTAFNMPLLLGLTGKKVLQSLPKRLDSSVEWEPIQEGSLIRLKTRYGQYLRANAGLPPWRNRITHDIPYRTSHQDWILWHVDVLRYRGDEGIPARPPPPPPGQEFINGYDTNEGLEDTGSPLKLTLSGPRTAGFESDDSAAEPVKGRVIKYEVVDDNGDVDQKIGEHSFTFKGNTLEELKKALEEKISAKEEFCLCSRNPLNGKLYPLRLHLPPNNAAMQVVIVPLTSKVAEDLWL
ncbi:CROLIN 1 [Hibiscus trionum]|uniref:CROLIN 1 n=1 Tax=Hibiscus trionum TaxID=183268 RepID=A0A9W7IWZ8_HIBTR|nr:CROLIN 1 [Hibiscus trionum]